MNSHLIFLYIILFSLTSIKCGKLNEPISVQEQDQIFETIIKVEGDSSWGKINRAKYGKYYLLSDKFNDTIFLDDTITRLIDDRINIDKIKKEYRSALSKNNKFVTNSFHLLHVKEYSNKIPEFLSFSKPMKYLDYYFVDFSFFSWSSGYKSTFVLIKDALGKFKPIYRRTYLVI